MIDTTEQAKTVVWLALSTDEKDDCLRLTSSLTDAINFAWNHYM